MHMTRLTQPLFSDVEDTSAHGLLTSIAYLFFPLNKFESGLPYESPEETLFFFLLGRKLKRESELSSRVIPAY